MSEARKYRAGDKVTVHGVVVAMSLEGPLVEFKRQNYYHSSLSFGVPFEEVATHTPKPREFKPGDMVTWGRGATALEFIAERDGFAIMWHPTYKIVERERVAEIRHADEAP